MRNSKVQVSQLTPGGRGAIATLLVTGDGAETIAGRFFRAASGRPLVEIPVRRVAFGRWQIDPENAGEELVVCRTGDGQVEIHCHGGKAAVAAITRSLLAEGCVKTTWQEVASDQGDTVIAAEARVALAEAKTQRTAAILLDQMHGALSNALADTATQLKTGQLDAAITSLEALRERGRIGLHLTLPWRVVLAGPPNVGKSSLINAILGYTRSIVFDQPGTTRDVLTALTALDGWPVEFSDTAGLRTTDDEIEQQGVTAARNRVRDADLVVLVCDASVPASAEEAALWEEFPQALIIENKCDLPRAGGRSETDHVRVSATAGEGLPELIQRIVKRLAEETPPAGVAVPFTPRQIDAIDTALAQLPKGQWQQAVAAIERLFTPAARY